MIIKRLLNAIVSIPALVLLMLVILGVIVGAIMISSGLLKSMEDGPVKIIFGVVAGAIITLLILGDAALGGWGITQIIKGNGILWRRVYKNDLLRDDDGNEVCIFDEDALIWRWGPFFRHKELVHPAAW